MSRLALVVFPRPRRSAVLAGLLALAAAAAAAACGQQSPTAPRSAARPPRFDTAPPDTTRHLGNYENPGV